MNPPSIILQLEKLDYVWLFKMQLQLKMVKRRDLIKVNNFTTALKIKIFTFYLLAVDNIKEWNEKQLIDS